MTEEGEMEGRGRSRGKDAWYGGVASSAAREEGQSGGLASVAMASSVDCSAARRD